MKVQHELKILCTYSELIPIEQLTDFQGGLKKINPDSLRRLKASLREGFKFPKNVWQHEGKNYIIDGHQTKKALIDLEREGWKLPAGVPCVFLMAKTRKEAKRALLQADSRYGKISKPGFAAFIADLDIGSLRSTVQLPDMQLPVQSPAVAPIARVDEAAELCKEWKCKRGQLWQLGAHRLLCMDSTNLELMQEWLPHGKCEVLVTSPPYWVGKRYEQEHSTEEITKFILRSTAVMDWAVKREGGRVIVNTGTCQIGQKTGQTEMWILLDKWIGALREHGWLLRYPRIWAKAGGVGGAFLGPRSDVVDVHWEFVAVFYYPHKPFVGQRKVGEPWAQLGVWSDIPGEATGHKHEASFPEEIPMRNIQLYSDQGDLVTDPFMGSGTTLVACETLKRKCIGVELLPEYVAVTLQRWVDMTGEKPKLLL